SGGYVHVDDFRLAVMPPIVEVQSFWLLRYSIQRDSASTNAIKTSIKLSGEVAVRVGLFNWALAFPYSWLSSFSAFCTDATNCFEPARNSFPHCAAGGGP